MPLYPLNRRLAFSQSHPRLWRSQNIFQVNRCICLDITLGFRGPSNMREDTKTEFWSVFRFECLALSACRWRNASSRVVIGCAWLHHAAIDGTVRIRRKHTSALCKHIYVWNCKCQIRWGGMAANHNWWVGMILSELLSYAGVSRHVKNARGSWSQWIH